jgi:hypothetical protein
MPNLYTHLDIDVDTAASIWLWRRIYEGEEWRLELKPATWSGDGLTDDDVALELDAHGDGIRSRRQNDGSVQSCFRVILLEHLPEDMTDEEADRLEQLVGPIADILDAQRRDGNLARLGYPPRYGIYGLSGTFLALKYTTETEQELVAVFSRILDGFVRLAELSCDVNRLAREVEMIGEVAILLDRDNPGLHRAIFRRGAKFLVFKDGHNLGVLREARERRHLGEILRDRIEEPNWFFHPRGHLAARGTRRAPARDPSRYTPHALAALLAEALEDPRHQVDEQYLEAGS